MSHRNTINPGRRFGSLVVIGEAERPVVYGGQKYSASIVKCDCGRVKTVQNSNLLHGRTTTCGVCCRRRPLKHGFASSLNRDRLYTIWNGMKARCTYNTPKNKNYAGRGISVCDEWRDDFAAFRKWSVQHGYRDDLSIDRIDNDKGYCPHNCRWVPQSSQSANRRMCVTLTAHGETMNISAWARRIGIPSSTIRWRLKHGATHEEAVAPRKVVPCAI